MFQWRFTSWRHLRAIKMDQGLSFTSQDRRFDLKIKRITISRFMPINPNQNQFDQPPAQ